MLLLLLSDRLKKKSVSFQGRVRWPIRVTWFRWCRFRLKVSFRFRIKISVLNLKIKIMARLLQKIPFRLTRLDRKLVPLLFKLPAKGRPQFVSQFWFWLTRRCWRRRFKLFQTRLLFMVRIVKPQSGSSVRFRVRGSIRGRFRY